MKRTNIYLTIGLIIVFFFGAMITFPSMFTDQSPYEITGVESYRTETGDYAFRTPPFEPGEKFTFGSDDSGKDVLSFVIYGAKLTLLIGLSVAVLRFTFGLIFGIRSAMGKQMRTLWVDQFNNVFNAIPPLIICIIILSIGYLKALPKTYSILVFVGIMTLVEWSRVAVLIRERAVIILNKDFIKSERIIGKSDAAIVVEHLLPHMFSELIVLFFMEISRVLTLMMQLGIFGIFIGNLKILSDTGPGMIIGKKTSYEPEWASMLGSSKNYIRVAPWIIMSCSAAFFISVLGFNFIGEGLRMLYQEGHQLFKNKRQQLISLLVVLAVFGLGFAVTFEPSVASGDYDQSFESVPEIFLGGSEEAETMAEEIVKRFEDLGVEKTKDQYLFPYEIQSYYQVKKAEVFVDNKRLSYGIEDIGLLLGGAI